MAYTPVSVHFPDGLSVVLATLQSLVDGQVLSDAAGYVVTATTTELWELRFTVPEACIGFYRILLFDGDGVVVGQRYIYLLDSTTRQYASDSLAEVQALFNTQQLLTNLSSGLGTVIVTQGDHTAALASVASNVGGIIKTGEQFEATSVYEAPRRVTFTRV